jgi:acetoin utilization protein AcuC
LSPETEVPQAWREHVLHLLGRQAPSRMTDGRSPVYRDWSQGYDPHTWLDRAINATRTAVFPLHGLDPLP